MRVKNTSPSALVVDGGRVIGAGQFAEVNSRDPAVAAHLDARRLVKPPTSRKPPPAPNEDPEPDVADVTVDEEETS